MIATDDELTSAQCPEPGVYQDVTFDEYSRWKAINASTICIGHRSMAHMLRHLNEPHKPPTDAMRRGGLIHAGELEPLTLLDRYVVMPAFEQQVRKPDGTEYHNPKASKAYRELVYEFRGVNSGKEIVSQEWYDSMLGMLDAISKHGRASEYLRGPGPTEVSITWVDDATGIRCKARIDKIDKLHQRLPDLKTTIDALRFDQSIVKYGYHIRGAFYEDGWLAVTGERYTYALVAVESELPHGVRAAPLDPGATTVGRGIYQRTLKGCAEAKRTGLWPGYEDPDSWTLPTWAMPDSYELVVASVKASAMQAAVMA